MEECNGKGTVTLSRDIFDEDGEYVDTEYDYDGCDGCERCCPGAA